MPTIGKLKEGIVFELAETYLSKYHKYGEDEERKQTNMLKVIIDKFIGIDPHKDQDQITYE